MIKNILKKNIFIDLIFIFLLSLTPLFWYKGETVMFGHDNVFPLDPTTFLIGRLSTWAEQGFGQSQASIMGTIPIHLADAIPYILGFTLQQTQKIVYIFWFFMMGFGAYILAYTINPGSRIFKLTSVILYQFNFFILQAWWIGERTKFSAYIAFPLILAVFLKVYWKKLSPLKGAIYSSLILFVFNAGGLFGISLYGGFFVGVAAFILFFSLISFLRKQYDIVKNLFLLIIFTLLGFILVNSYYLFPAFSQIAINYAEGIEKSGGRSGFVDWASMISANASYINLMRLQGIAEWYDNLEHPFSKYFFENPFLIIASFLWLILALCALMVVKKKEKLELVLYLFLVYLLGILLTAGTHPPFGFLYESFIKFVPGAVAFRSPYFKFAPAIFLASSFLIAFFADHFPRKIKHVFFIFLTAVIFAYHFPFFTGDFFSWTKGFSTKLEVPKYVFAFGEWVNKDNQINGRILMLPPNNPNLGFSKYNWGYLSFQSLPTFFTNKSVIINNDRLNTEETALVNVLYKSIASGDRDIAFKLISLLRIKYFVLQEDTVYDSRSTLPLDFLFYKQILENNFNFPIVKKIDRWTVYKINSNILPQFFTTNNLAIFQGKVRELENYLNLFSSTNIFARKDDKIAIKVPENLIRGYYIPAECLNCDQRNNPFIKIPERNILPDSPFYPLVMFMEKIQNSKIENKIDRKNLIYHYLGLTLKRTGEIKKIIISQKGIDQEVVNRYNLLLEAINNNFNQLENYQDKFNIARDIYFYIENERVALIDLFGIYATYGEPVAAIGDAALGIASTLKTIDPYLFKLNPVNNRLYQVSVIDSGQYNLFLKRDNFQRFKNNEIISLSVDGSVKREMKPDSSSLTKWIDFGAFNLIRGKHNLLLSFPELPNVAEVFKKDKIEINIASDTKCFTSKINNFDSSKTYRVKLNYKNDFSNDLFYYAWELKKSNKKLYNVIKLRASYVTDEMINLIKTDASSKGVLIGICSRNLTEEAVKDKITITINEMIEPTIFAVAKQLTSSSIDSVDYQQSSPTSYKISFKNNKENSLLVFLERYDNGWTLSGFEDKHFRVNGYANAWIVDKSGNFTLNLEYKPQKIFVLGSVVSLFSISGALLFLLKDKLKTKRKI